MGVPGAAVLLGRSRAAYRGVDRRGIVARLANPDSSKLALLVVLAVLLVPLLGAAALTLDRGLSSQAASIGASDAALVAFVASGLVLLCRWRLVGDAASIALAAADLVAGLILVPATHFGGSGAGLVAALQMSAVAVIVGASLAAGMLPEICADLRPTLAVCSAVAVVLALAIPLSLLPVPGGAQPGSAGLVAVNALEALGCTVVALGLLGRGVRGRHSLFVASGGMLLAIAASRAAACLVPLTATSPAAAVPSFFLLLGAVCLLFISGNDLRSAFGAIVLHDVRGRRRWVAAESELDRVRAAYRGQSHDVTSLLSAVDGTLLVLATEGERLPAERSRMLLTAVRGQIQRLAGILTEDRSPERLYDLSDLLQGVVALHSSGSTRIQLSSEPGLQVPGHPDRVVRIVNNLLVNSLRHAPGARVALRVRRLEQPSRRPLAELVVSDDGPGLSDSELALALEPGWRGAGAAALAGMGLGLSQCRELTESEGGELQLSASDPAAPLGARGLTARVLLPLLPSPTTSAKSSILQMPQEPPDGINGGVTPAHPKTTVITDPGW
ncbi:MAG: sensor histidine kinase [Candidatus Dormibacteria bacterium]